MTNTRTSISHLTIGNEAGVEAARAHIRRVTGRLGLGLHERTQLMSLALEAMKVILQDECQCDLSISVVGVDPPRLELALAPCVDAHAAPAQSLQITLPETALGVLAWGGHISADETEGGIPPASAAILLKEIPRSSSICELEALREEMKCFEVDALHECERDDEELFSVLEMLGDAEDTGAGLARELEDTNRGVVALYGQMEDQANLLREADALKDRFISFLSHEFRTPVNSIIALSRLLLDRVDGELTEEQEKQVKLIARAASDLSAIVSDLLDIAKAQAGKLEVKREWLDASSVLAALRGLMRPLSINPDVSLVFEEPGPRLVLRTDEGKLSQVLRNFITNALKFTTQGSVRVKAYASTDEDEVIFEVQDTGCGIAPENQAKIFQDFVQLDPEAGKTARGTGLGLPLSRQLAELLGGRIEVESRVGEGSMFRLILPRDGAQLETAPGDLEEGT